MRILLVSAAALLSVSISSMPILAAGAGVEEKAQTAPAPVTVQQPVAPAAVQQPAAPAAVQQPTAIKQPAEVHTKEKPIMSTVEAKKLITDEIFRECLNSETVSPFFVKKGGKCIYEACLKNKSVLDAVKNKDGKAFAVAVWNPNAKVDPALNEAARQQLEGVKFDQQTLDLVDIVAKYSAFDFAAYQEKALGQRPELQEKAVKPTIVDKFPGVTFERDTETGEIVVQYNAATKQALIPVKDADKQVTGHTEAIDDINKQEEAKVGDSGPEVSKLKNLQEQKAGIQKQIDEKSGDIKTASDKIDADSKGDLDALKKKLDDANAALETANKTPTVPGAVNAKTKKAGPAVPNPAIATAKTAQTAAQTAYDSKAADVKKQKDSLNAPIADLQKQMDSIDAQIKELEEDPKVKRAAVFIEDFAKQKEAHVDAIATVLNIKGAFKEEATKLKSTSGGLSKIQEKMKKAPAATA